MEATVEVRGVVPVVADIDYMNKVSVARGIPRGAAPQIHPWVGKSKNNFSRDQQSSSTGRGGGGSKEARGMMEEGN